MEWISVKESLPFNDDNNKCQSIHVWLFIPTFDFVHTDSIGRVITGQGSVIQGYFETWSEAFVARDHSRVNKKVTHWMMKPLPPKIN